MGESQALINTVLNDIKAEDEYENLIPKTKNIIHKFSYRAHGGRLKGYKKNQESQTFDVILKGDKQTEPKTRIDLIETGMALLMQRYDTFGPFHQYPKTFFVGPSLWDNKEIKLLGVIELLGVIKLRGVIDSDPADPRPYIRDVDRLISAEVDSKGVSLYIVQMLHDDMSSPGTVQAHSVPYRFYPKNTTLPTYELKERVPSVTENLFRDGSLYNFNRTSEIEIKIESESPHLSALAVAGYFSRNRKAVWNEDAQTEAKALAVNKDNLNRMLAIILTGQNPYVAPEDKNQRNHPVPPGKVTADRLASVLKNVVLPPPVPVEPELAKARISERKMPFREITNSDDESVSSTDESFVRISVWGGYPQSDDELFTALDE